MSDASDDPGEIPDVVRRLDRAMFEETLQEMKDLWQELDQTVENASKCPCVLCNRPSVLFLTYRVEDPEDIAELARDPEYAGEKRLEFGICEACQAPEWHLAVYHAVRGLYGLSDKRVSKSKGE